MCLGYAIHEQVYWDNGLVTVMSILFNVPLYMYIELKVSENLKAKEQLYKMLCQADMDFVSVFATQKVMFALNCMILVGEFGVFVYQCDNTLFGQITNHFIARFKARANASRIEHYLADMDIICDVRGIVYNARSKREKHDNIPVFSKEESCWYYMLEEEGCFITPEEIKKIEGRMKNEEIEWNKLK